MVSFEIFRAQIYLIRSQSAILEFYCERINILQTGKIDKF